MIAPTVEEARLRAVRCHEHGGPEVLRIEEVPEPMAAAGQVLIRVEAAGANVIDARANLGRVVFTP